MEKRFRQNIVKVHLSDDEKKVLESKYALSGHRNREAFLRQLIVYGYVYEADYSPMREYNMSLARIAHNLNQIAKHANTYGTLYAEEMSEIKEKMGEIWQLQRSILSKGV